MQKKTLRLLTLIAGSIIFVISVAGLLSTLLGGYTHGMYYYDGKVDSDHVQLEITLEDHEEGLVECLVDYNEKDYDTEIERFEMRYRVYDGEIYIGEEYYGYTDYEKVGKISLFKLELKHLITKIKLY